MHSIISNVYIRKVLVRSRDKEASAKNKFINWFPLVALFVDCY